jgi:probable rRNA maturation factor
MTVFVADEQDADIPVDALKELAELVLTHEGYPSDTEVTVLFVDDESIAGYNERFMGREGPTDVLAFPLEELRAGVAPSPRGSGPPLHLCDVIIAPDKVSRQAAERKVAFEDEISLMVVHGMLHLMGWDHPDDDLAERMEAKEAEILAEVGRTRP